VLPSKPRWFLFGALLLSLLVVGLTFNLAQTTQAMQDAAPIPPAPASIRGAVATDTPACGLAWRGVSSPHPAGTSELDGLAGISDSDVWAAGTYTATGVTHTLIEHWNGSSLSIIPGPDGGGTNSRLAAVAARASDDVWSVGYTGTANASQTLVEHWDGTSWSVVPSPNVDTRNNLLYAVAGAGPDDVWALGTHLQTNINLYRTTAMHWNGSGWTFAYNSPGYGNNYFYGAFAFSQNVVWAVGGEEDMAQHWNGTSWSPSGGVLLGDIYGVVAAAPDDVWAVGNYLEQGYSSVYHYDGSIWLPFPNNTGTHLRAISAIWRDDIWAAGFDDSNHLLIERYNDPCAGPTNTPTGTPPTATPTATHTTTSSPTNTHTPTNTPQPTGPPAHTNTATNTPTIPAGTSTPLAPTGTPTHASTSTSTPFVPTATSTPFAPSNTPTTAPIASPSGTPTIPPAASASPTASPSVPTGSTATAMMCTLEFTDVQPNSTFYPYIHRLACQGIISGYTSGCSTGNPCFRPGNNVTRGQTAKIVSNAATFNDRILPDTQTFSDVPPGSTFWLYVERVALHGAINGYACGGLAEPCVPPTNRPYFRPTANLTRGQTAKIVAVARGLPAPPAGQQTFQDVPEGSTFWMWVEELAGTGAINGYACGGPGEPCIPPSQQAILPAGQPRDERAAIQDRC